MPPSVSVVQLLRRLTLSVLGAGVLLILAPGIAQIAQATPSEHPQLYVNGEKASGGKGGNTTHLVPAPTEERASHTTPYIGWHAIVTLESHNALLGSLQCGNIFWGQVWNETEKEAGNPSAVGQEGAFQTENTSETERGYGEILNYEASGYLNSAAAEGAQEESSKCKTSSGAEAWVTPEPELHKVKTGGVVCTDEAKHVVSTECKAASEETEKIVLRSASREPPSLPWKGRSEGARSAKGVESFSLYTGIPPNGHASLCQSITERCSSGNHGECYPGREVTERLRDEEEIAEGVSSTEERLKAAPTGCIRVAIIVPSFGLEIQYQGSQKAFISPNGEKACQTGAEGEFKTAAETGVLEDNLVAENGNTATAGTAKFRECGWNHLENLTTGTPG
jgi:hypothetical protein